jgi:hypothetical protein
MLNAHDCLVTHRCSSDVSGLDFGITKPSMNQAPWSDLITTDFVLVYAPIQSAASIDHGYMFTCIIEIELVSWLRDDPKWT